MNTNPTPTTTIVGAPTQEPMFNSSTHPEPLRPEGPDWPERGTCRSDPNPDRWITLPQLRIHGVNNPAYREQVTTLKTVCASCPVNSACLYTALNAHERVDGIWGGTDEYERATLMTNTGQPQPGPAGIPPLNDNDAATDLALSERFIAQRFAHQGFGNQQIATLMGTSTMTISRFLTDRDRPRGTRCKTSETLRRTSAPLTVTQ